MDIPLSKPDITDTEREAVMQVLHTPTLSLGPKVREFEQKIADYVGVEHAIGVNSGTSGLHLIIRALGIGEGDEVITTPFSFISSANCILYENAKPVFVDIDPITLTIDPAYIETAITHNTKAILAVDVFGHPAHWDKLEAIAAKYHLHLIEDAAEALGSTYQGRKCGSFGDAAVFSFYPNKQATTGEGGCIVTNDKELADLCHSMANQGRRIEGGQWLEHVRLGYNYRLDELSAALGIAQLTRFPEIPQKRAQVAQWYAAQLQEVPEVMPPSVLPEVDMSWFVYVIRLKEPRVRADRDAVIAKLQKLSIQCGTYFQSIHLQPFYQERFHFRPGLFPSAEHASDHTIALPFYTSMTEEEVQTVVTHLKQALPNT